MDIFISYSQTDKPWVSNLATALETHGYTVWWDHRILAGDDFDEVIQLKLKQVKCVVTVWSENSIKSNWVRGESNIALDKGILIPISIHTVKPPVVFRTIHTLNLKGWDGDALDPQFKNLLNAIEQFFSASSKNPETHSNNNYTKTAITKKSKKISILLSFLGTIIIGIGTNFFYEPSLIEKFNEYKTSLDNSVPSSEEEITKGREVYKNNNFQLAAKIFTPLAKSNGIAQVYLGDMYLEGKGVKQNKEKANELYTKSFVWAKNNEAKPEAMHLLGYLYDKGLAVKQSDKKAVEYYQKAADLGYAQASANLGYFYQYGRMGSSDKKTNNKKAVELYRQALKQDPKNRYALFRLGYMYDKGLAVKQSDKKAVEYYQKAADLGYAQASANLGNFYQYGRMGTSDKKANNKKAVELYYQALKQDRKNRYALFRLGYMYQNGFGVEKSTQKAVKLYQKVINQDSRWADEAKKMLKIITDTENEKTASKENNQLNAVTKKSILSSDLYTHAHINPCTNKQQTHAHKNSDMRHRYNCDHRK